MSWKVSLISNSTRISREGKQVCALRTDAAPSLARYPTVAPLQTVEQRVELSAKVSDSCLITFNILILGSSLGWSLPIAPLQP